MIDTRKVKEARRPPANIEKTEKLLTAYGVFLATAFGYHCDLFQKIWDAKAVLEILPFQRQRTG